MHDHLVKGYSAGILIFEKRMSADCLPTFLKGLKEELRSGAFSISFAQVTQVITELCVDVYEYPSMQYQYDLSTSFKT